MPSHTHTFLPPTQEGLSIGYRAAKAKAAISKHLVFYNRKIQLQHLLGSSAVVHADPHRKSFTFHGTLPMVRQYVRQSATWLQDHMHKNPEHYHLPPGDDE